MVRRVVVAGLEIIEAGFGVVDIAAVSQRGPERDCRAGGLRRKKRDSTLLSYVGTANTQKRPTVLPGITVFKRFSCGLTVIRQ